MSQHDYVIDNQDGASFRADINNALGAVVSLNSGPTAPAATFAYMLWQDTTAGVLKQRNSTNTGWDTFGVNSSALAKAWVLFNGTGTVAITKAYNVTSITDNGTGDYTVNFTTAMADANYVCSADAAGSAYTQAIHLKAGSALGAPSLKSTTQAQFASFSGVSATDAAHVMISVHG